MKKTKLLLSITAISIILIFSISGCKDEPTENNEKVDFCSCINTENIAKSIPIIDEFLSELSENMNDEQKLQELVTWLKSHPCIIDADIICQSCIETEPQISEILISFEENGETKDIVFDISMTNPLKIAGYNEKHYPLDIPFREIIYNGECFCPWTNLKFGKVVIVNSDEELKKYINCTCGNFPKIDFSKQSFLISLNYSPDGKLFYHVAKSITQNSTKNYKLDARVRLINTCRYDYGWSSLLITNKINEDCIFEINEKFDEESELTCECADEFFFNTLYNKIYFGDNFLNDILLISFNPDFPFKEIEDYIYNTGLINSIFWKENNWIFVNTKEQKSCNELKDIIRIFESSKYINFVNFVFEVKPLEYDFFCGGYMYYLNEFSVGLHSENDFPLLQEVIQKTNTKIKSHNDEGTYYILTSDKNSEGDAIKMANYFYETGYFISSRPLMKSIRISGRPVYQNIFLPNYNIFNNDTFMFLND